MIYYLVSIISVLAGLIDGVLEGYSFDGRKSFERKYGVSEDSFFGSKSWKSIYIDGDPQKGYKSGLLAWFGAFDFYHVADDLRKFTYLLAGITVTAITGAAGATTIQPLFGFICIWIVSAIGKFLGLKYIRS